MTGSDFQQDVVEGSPPTSEVNGIRRVKIERQVGHEGPEDEGALNKLCRTKTGIKDI